MKITAVIDIGSNSIRLMLAEVNGHEIRSISKRLVMTRMGQNLYGSMILHPDAIQRGAQAVADFADDARDEGAQEILVFATSAVRSASNRQEFIKLVKKMTGIDVDVISGEQEAELGFIGAVNGNGGVLDIGGGSTEVICGKNGGIEYTKSFDIGTVRAHDIFGDTYRGGETCVIEWAQKPFSAAAQSKPILECEKWTGIGGTVTQMAVLDLKMPRYEPDAVQGHVMGIGTVEEMLCMLWSISLEQREALIGMDPRRADIIPFGAAITLAFMRAVSAKCLFVSDRDNMEGYLIKHLK